MKEALYNILIGSISLTLLIAAIAYFHKAVIILCIVLCGLCFAYIIGGVIRDIYKDWKKTHAKGIT